LPGRVHSILDAIGGRRVAGARLLTSLQSAIGL
jgi:hypothetical protein